MNWYETLLDQPANESPLEKEWKSLAKRIHIFQKRFDIAKNDPSNKKDTINDLYWEIEEMKGKKRQIEEILRKNKEEKNIVSLI